MDDEIEEGMVIDEDLNLRHKETDERKPEKSPYEMLKESKTSLEQIVSQMLSMKKQRQHLSKSQLSEFVTQTFIHFVTLRQANRSILLEEDRVKAETERAKAPVDFTTLQLHNLMYEKSHYVKAIKACKDFKSKYPDIELVPEEEFFRDAPENIRDTVTPNDSHDLMLKRLNFELFQRKELCKLREQLEERKKSLMDTIANRKKFLSSLPSHLKSLKKASLPVQNQLGIMHTKKMKQHHSAELLPPPLYVIYSQLVAQKEAFEENIELEIVGSMKDAQVFVRQQANKDSGISSNLDSSRMDEDAADEEDDGQRRRKRPKRFPVKENLEQAGYYQVHPLRVVLHIYDDEVCDPKSRKLLSLKFEYMLKLNVVCVCTEGSHERGEDNILCNLFPDDTGLELPHQSAKLAVGDSLKFDERRASRPYKWAQHLAGIDFLPEVSPLLTALDSSDEMNKSEIVASGLSEYRQQNRVLTILQRLRSRKKAQLALVEQLNSLALLKWPGLTYKGVPWALHSPACNFHSWSLLGSSTNPVSSPIIDTDSVQEPTDAAPNGLSDNSRNGIEGVREDGELPVLFPPASVATDVIVTSSKLSVEHSRQLVLISKSISPLHKAKALSFKRQDEEDILLDIDSDREETVPLELEAEHTASSQNYEADKSWVNFGVREFCLILSRMREEEKRSMTLEAKIKIFIEYPLRPPLFSLSISAVSSEENRGLSEDSNWYNELRAMEAEINLHMLKMLPLDEENYTLAHQVLCLAMLFDYYMDEASATAEKREDTSVVDVGLCRPVTGRLLDRLYRGRDRRKIITWKAMK